MNKSKDYAKVATREKRYSTLAHKEGQEASRRARRESAHHEPIAAADSRREAKNAEMWAKKRTAWASKAKKNIAKK
jgi:hypothetical protein